MTSELDPQARALIGLALKGEQRLPRSRERVRRGVLTALAAPAALGASEAAAASKAAGVAGGAATTGTKALIFGGAAWLKVAPFVAIGVTASVVGLKHVQSPSAPAKAALASAAAPVAQPAQPPAPVAPPEPAEPARPAASTELAPARPTTPARSAEPTSHAPPSLATDLEALQRAQRTLNAGNAASALQELRAVRSGALRAERSALEVFAHCALGNVAQARQQATLFRQLAPRSPLLPRVDASCAGK